MQIRLLFRHYNIETRGMQPSYHLLYGLWWLLDLAFLSNIEKLLYLDRELLKGLLSSSFWLSKKAIHLTRHIHTHNRPLTDPIWPIFKMLHTYLEKSRKYREMFLVSASFAFNLLRLCFSLWKDNPAMKIYKKFRLIVSYMTMILVCGNYWTILSSLGIWKCRILNWRRPRSQIVRQGRNGIRRRIGQNSNNSTDINKEMSSIRWLLLWVFFRCT